MIGTRIFITGIVQGVGFRPFVYNQAIQLGLKGWVCNSTAGVEIEVNGESESITAFIHNIKSKTPPLAQIDSLEFHQIPFSPANTFAIVESIKYSNAFQPISPDICICPDCIQELFDPTNRRYRYPFINCTNCGPRLTIIEEIPYDRPNTTMMDFSMCHDCESEYIDPSNRRFHAQPIACPECGPHVWLEVPGKPGSFQNRIVANGNDAILRVQKKLKKGGIVAIKGLGGFHLACDATNSKTVAELRRRKLRVDKPFALMMPDLQSVETYCLVNECEMELLESRERPIVILPRTQNLKISTGVSPNQETLGVMLPYTPLHYLLFSSPDNRQKMWNMPPLVMTSGNMNEEPIAIRNEDAQDRLNGLADAYLMHDRKIHTRCDDSVVRTFRGTTLPLRRSRGYAPFPVYLKSVSPQVLAVGAELKNTFCITRDHYAFLSHHIGDMENVETFEAFTRSVSQYESLFRFKPEAIAYDLHPNYLATRYAIERSEREGIPSFGVQHHHSHIVSNMAENLRSVNHPVIGIAFDGTGYGDDGAIWGGEFLVADFRSYRRVCHLKYIPLPGGDTAIRKPARTALAYLWVADLGWEPEYYPVKALCSEERTIIRSQLENNINTPLTSSMGRFFDAVASIAGIRQLVNYEGQAAIELEAKADSLERGEYELSLEADYSDDYPTYIINPAPLLTNLILDVQRGISVSKISARFHNTIARIVSLTCNRIRQDYGLNDVVLSGGVWQNMFLLNRTYDMLSSQKFVIQLHNQVPTNDGGLALGQALIAINQITEQKSHLEELCV